MKTCKNCFYKSAYKYLLYSKWWKHKNSSTGMNKDVLQTFQLNQTFVIDINLIDYL